MAPRKTQTGQKSLVAEMACRKLGRGVYLLLSWTQSSSCGDERFAECMNLFVYLFRIRYRPGNFLSQKFSVPFP
jgi:hypothetical protein